MHIWDTIGWAGTGLYVLAYFLLASGFLTLGRAYYPANLVAALCVVTVSLSKDSTQAVVINALYAMASCYALSGRLPPLMGLREGHMRMGLLLFIGGGIAAAPWLGLAGAASWIAWGSVVGFVAGYLLFLAKRIGLLEFHAVNAMSSAAIVPELALQMNWSVVVLEVIWISAALIGIVTELANRMRETAAIDLPLAEAADGRTA